MAIAGEAGNCYNMQVVNGKLERGTHGLRQKVQKNMDIAIQELLEGKLVHVHAYGDNHNRVAKTVEMVLKGGQE